MLKHWNTLTTDEAAVQDLHQQLNIHPFFCRLLVQRGIRTFEEARQFFRPTLEDLHNPFLMKGMEAAVKRIQQAIFCKEKILLYGDYDVDGTTAVATLFSFLQPLHTLLDFYLPDRYKEGYGVSIDGIEYAIKNGVQLLLTLDCGIKDVKSIAKAQQHGIDVIVCDHHLPGAELPPAFAILDPKQEDCPYPYKELSGCGIALKLAQAITQQMNLQQTAWQQLLELTVLSIASDIVPMTGENRILAYYGLKQLNRTERPGLQALLAQSGRNLPLTISDIVFGLGPMINAAGRLADADQAVRLLLAQDKEQAVALARILGQRNTLRKEFDHRMAEEAAELFQKQVAFEEQRSIVLYQPHWHKGIVGIAAARMVEQFHRPTIILTESGGKAVGSARSVRGFDIHRALEACADLLLNYGGHSHAAGLTLWPENITAFRERFEGFVRTHLKEQDLLPEIPIAGVVDFKDITPQFWRILQQFAPFGPGNRNPVFVTQQVRDTGYTRPLRGNHLRLCMQQDGSPIFQGIGFGMGQAIDRILQKKPFEICYTLQENNWKGERTLQLLVKDIRFQTEKQLL